MLKLNDLEVYKVAMEIGDTIWKIVDNWDFFNRDTLGKQITRSADSIALNISEGFGRFHFAENKNFCYYSRGSAYETATEVNKAYNRNLISEENYQLLQEKLNLFLKLVNPYIKSIGKQKVQ